MEDGDFPDMEPDDALFTTFQLAADFVTDNASVMQQDDLLYLYGRYKQSTIGKCSEPMPGILKFRSRGKWTVWNGLGDMSREEAMKQYIEKVTRISPDWDTSEKKVAKKPPMTRHFGPVSSVCQNTDPELNFEAKTVFDFVKEGNLAQIEELVTANPGCVRRDFCDENGLSLLHWACDRGLVGVGEFLVSAGADVNCQDKDGQTPLHYASSCGHGEVVIFLLRKGASVSVFDADGLSPADVAYSTNIKELLMTNAV